MRCHVYKHRGRTEDKEVARSSKQACKLGKSRQKAGWQADLAVLPARFCVRCCPVAPRAHAAACSVDSSLSPPFHAEKYQWSWLARRQFTIKILFLMYFSIPHQTPNINQLWLVGTDNLFLLALKGKIIRNKQNTHLPSHIPMIHIWVNDPDWHRIV